MKDVSCRMMDVFFQKARKQKIDHARLLEGTGVPVELAFDKNEFVSWEAFRVFMKNAGEIWPGDGLVTLGKEFLSAPLVRPFGIVGRLLFTTEQFYEWIFDKTSKVGEGVFACIDSRLAKVGSNHLQLELRVKPGYAPSVEFCQVCLGNFIALPGVLGLPHAQVEMTLLPDGARYDVRVPPGGGLLRRFFGWLLIPFTARTAARELKEAHEGLLSRYQELSNAKKLIADQAAQLQTVEQLGRELSALTTLSDTIETIVRILSTRLAALAGRVHLSSSTTGELQLVRTFGEPAGPPQRTIEMNKGPERLGRIEVWGRGGDATAFSILDDLQPWLAIAITNARSFALLKEAHEGLEKKVEQRTEALRDSIQQLTLANQQKTAFFANASHELRTPLTLLLAPLEHLAQSDALTLEAREELSGAVKAGYRLAKLVNDILDLSKLEAGRMHLRTAPTDLARLLSESARRFRPALSQRSARLKLELPEELVVVADPERMEQVALNLLSNAVKHTPDRGEVRVALARRGTAAEFLVENTGDGIDADDLPTLFDRFAQSPRSRARRFGTTGLGLPVVKDLVEMHDGSIRVENTPGEKVAFVVTLPIGNPHDSAEPAVLSPPSRTEMFQYEVMAQRESDVPPAPEPALENLPVLLIAEDNTELRRFLVRQLKSRFSIVEAADGESALKLAREHLPDVVLSDYMMPNRDGLSLARELKASRATMDIPVLLLTARGDTDYKTTALSHGADDYIVKPFHMDEVTARLNVHLRVRQLATKVAESTRLASLGTLVAGVAHEIRNPLNGIVNALAPVREHANLLPAASREMLDIAMQSAKRIDTISGQLLEQARAGEGQKTEVEIGRNVALAVQLLSYRTGNGPRVVFETEPGEAVVAGEPGALHQVWVNLIDNAISSAGPSGHVDVRVRSEAATVRVDVRDDGAGIDAKNLRRIFDPFFTTKAVGSGTGLGLSVAKEIVLRHGGTISVDSAVGQGARFCVMLPKLAANGSANAHH